MLFFVERLVCIIVSKIEYGLLNDYSRNKKFKCTTNPVKPGLGGLRLLVCISQFIVTIEFRVLIKCVICDIASMRADTQSLWFLTNP